MKIGSAVNLELRRWQLTMSLQINKTTLASLAWVRWGPGPRNLHFFTPWPPAPLGLRMASCSCCGDFAPNRLCMCGCMHERAPKAAVDAYARRGHRHRRALRGYISFQAASTRAYIRRPMPMRVVYMRELAMAMASHMCTCGANPACERASTAAPGVITAPMHSAPPRPC